MPAEARAEIPDDRSGLCYRSSFSFEIDGHVFMRRYDALVPEPMRDRAEIDSGFEQVDGGAMADAVWMNAFPRKRRARLCRPERMPTQD